MTIKGVSIEEARKIVSAVHRNGTLPGVVRHVRRASLEAVRAAGCVPALEVRAVQHSRIDPFVKYALAAPDGQVIETVRIPLEHGGRHSVCLSSQVGCGLACAFCATGRMGLRRNLKTWEIVEQVRIVRRGLDRARGQRVHGAVFQGMGEPLANADSVIEAIQVLTEPSALAIDGRNITVCTAGIPAGIRRLAQEVPKVRLGISIVSTRREVRLKLMPVSHAHPLHDVLDAAAEHARITALSPMWAVTLLDGVNDSEEDARQLAHLAQDFTLKTGLRPRISIIPYNSTGTQDSFGRTTAERETEYRRVLRNAGVASHKRYSGGGDVFAACGQLTALSESN
ncbi:MAG TPA: radical SAM protein [Acidobacteriota bacterium]|nr:radical SAM protein [Acidobacteriota bacterium]